MSAQSPASACQRHTEIFLNITSCTRCYVHIAAIHRLIFLVDRAYGVCRCFSETEPYKPSELHLSDGLRLTPLMQKFWKVLNREYVLHVNEDLVLTLALGKKVVPGDFVQAYSVSQIAEIQDVAYVSQEMNAEGSFNLL